MIEGMTGADVLENATADDSDDVAALRDLLFLKAADAREDLTKFFDFVMREERSNLPITTSPHQRVILNFIQDHYRCVLILPVGHSKTFCLVAYTLWMLGRNTSLRGAAVSAVQGQSEKVTMMVRDYIEKSAELRLVFPNLYRSQNPGDHWTQTALVVNRPAGIRDPSLVAVGIGSENVLGSRLDWAIVDDLLNSENTNTADAMKKVNRWIDTTVLSRLEKSGEGRCVISNTPWHPHDLVMSLQKAGWATLRMDAEGFVYVQDDVERMRVAEGEGMPFCPWDSDELRPASDDPNDMRCRLVAHDPDPDGDVTLWPERIDRQELTRLERTANSRQAFLQSYMTRPLDPDAIAVKDEWIERCLAVARNAGVHALVESMDHAYISRVVEALGVAAPGGWAPQSFTGVDLAFSERSKSDDTAFFTFCPLPSGHRLLLNIRIGKWSGPTVMSMVLHDVKAFGSIAAVEDNGAQKMLVQFALKQNASATIKGCTTGKNKTNPDYGIQSIFVEIENGAWLIPNDRNGRIPPVVEKWIEGMQHYSPSAHTADALMAMFFAREIARKLGRMQTGGQTSGLRDFNSR